MIKKFNLIAACDNDNGIGKNNDLPWLLPKEYEYFQFITQRINSDNDIFLNSYKEKLSSDLIKKCDLKLNKLNINKTNSIQELLFKSCDKVDNFSNVNDQKKSLNCLIMGRLTWLSIPKSYRPLKNRFNFVISNNYNAEQLGLKEEFLFKSLNEALIYASNHSAINKIFVAGGEQVYFEAIKYSECEKIYLTKIFSNFSCNKFFPKISDDEFIEINELGLKDNIQIENNIEYCFCIFKRKN